MTAYHNEYLQRSGFESIDSYYNYLETHPDDVDALVVVLTIMLNCVHLCVHHMDGLWHTHIKTCPCSCSLHLASMGKNTFVALQCIKKLRKTSTAGDSETAATPFCSWPSRDKQEHCWRPWNHCHPLLFLNKQRQTRTVLQKQNQTTWTWGGSTVCHISTLCLTAARWKTTFFAVQHRLHLK